MDGCGGRRGAERRLIEDRHGEAKSPSKMKRVKGLKRILQFEGRVH